MTTSCTHALEIAALLLNLEPGDEVIVPSFTFVSTVNAFVLRGARPVFIDVRPDTLNLDENLLAGLGIVTAADVLGAGLVSAALRRRGRRRHHPANRPFATATLGVQVDAEREAAAVFAVPDAIAGDDADTVRVR